MNKAEKRLKEIEDKQKVPPYHRGYSWVILESEKQGILLGIEETRKELLEELKRVFKGHDTLKDIEQVLK